MTFDPNETPNHKAKIKVIGVGGGGTNAVSTMVRENIEGVDFISANTDVQSLRSALAPTKIQIGKELTKGLGAGANAEIGEAAVEENKDVAYRANVDLARHVAQVCALGNIKLVHISSGCIYSGDNGGKGYTEEDSPNFSFETGSYYSGTKALAETLVAGTLDEVYICRLRIPFNSKDPFSFKRSICIQRYLLNSKDPFEFKRSL